jgi:hypothetical protein
MIERLIAGSKRAFGFHDSGHNPDISLNDRFLVSYPTRDTCGGTTEAPLSDLMADLGYLLGVRY